ncbi:MAG: hypothetical protein RSB91_03625, partial [Clostridia bacterium]
MKHLRKASLLLLCLTAALLLSACHTESDPWPVTNGGTAPQNNVATDTTHSDTAVPAVVENTA